MFTNATWIGTSLSQKGAETSGEADPVRNPSRCDSIPSGALNAAGIVLKCKPAAEQGDVISNGVDVKSPARHGTEAIKRQSIERIEME
jgi:hypothetical protein